MKIFEIGTGYTSIPARMGAATEIVVEELARSMIKQGVDVNIVDIRDANRKKSDLPIIEVYMPQFFSGTDIKLGLFHKLKRVLYSISLTYKLHKLIRKHKEKVALHFHNQYNLFFFLKLTPEYIRNKVIIGYTVHSHVWFDKWENIEHTIRKRYFQEVYSCQHADKVFVLNDIVTDLLVEKCDVNRKKVIKVINGVNIKKYNENFARREDIKSICKKYNIEGKKVMLQVGSVCDRKNQLGTLELLIPFMQNDENIVMAYAGGIIDSAYAELIRNRAEETGLKDRVIYWGEVSPGYELNLLYTVSYATFMNSKSEAFALVMAESLAASRPIFINESIMSSLSFLNGKEGEGIIRIKDTFKDDFIRLLSDKSYYKEMQKKGRDFIVNEYSWDIAAKEYSKVFDIS